jgi:hypothetical protein
VQRRGARHLVGAPGTRVSKVRLVLSLWRVALGGADAGAAVDLVDVAKAADAADAADATDVAAAGAPGAAAMPTGRASPAGAGREPLAAGWPAADGSRAASASSSCTGCPASSLNTDSMRPAYWARIQSSLNRLGTRSASRSAPGSEGWTSGAGSGRIQVLNCCSGNSLASRSQPRCHRSRLMGVVEIFFFGEPPALGPACGDASYPQFRAGGQAPASASTRGASV